MPYKKWSHIVGTISGTTGKVYINGVLKKEGAVDAVPATTGEVRIGSGRAWHDSDDYFKGNIDEVMIFNRALSVEEVKKLYDKQK